MDGDPDERDGDLLPASRTAIIATLLEHGLTGAAAVAAWSIARELIRGTRRRGIEYAASISLDGGKLVGPTLTGTPSRTDISSHIARFERGREYLQIHTHPRSTSFSDRDLLLLSTQPAIRVMAVVGANGVWHVVSRRTGVPAIDPRAVFDDFLEESRRLAAQPVPAVERPHVVMQRVADRHALRYDRVTGTPDERSNS